MKTASSLLISFAIALLVVALGLRLSGQFHASGIICVAGVTSLAIGSGLSNRLRSFAFSLYVGSFVALAMCFPSTLNAWGAYETKQLIVPLIQIIMFGMGTMLSLADFSRVMQIPKGVLIGILLQFTIMPVVGALLARMFGFPAEVAAGVVLIGSCPGGVASNLMTFIAKGNVALSVTMTACSTLISPLVTPLAMQWLAGQYIQIEFGPMMLEILKMVILPIVGGLLANRFLTYLDVRGPWLDKLLSLLAMSAICLIIGIITSLSRDALMKVGLALIAAAIIHNTVGYLLGYGGAWLAGLNESDRRTVAIEVGLQNGGMASGLAVKVLASTDAALAPAIFGPWMNISGSILASWWRDRGIDGHSLE